MQAHPQTHKHTHTQACTDNIISFEILHNLKNAVCKPEVTSTISSMKAAHIGCKSTNQCAGLIRILEAEIRMSQQSVDPLQAVRGVGACLRL